MTFEPVDGGWKERVEKSFARQGALALVGARIVDLQPGRCRVAMPFRPQLGQQHGYFHAGIVSTAADAAGGCAAASLFAALDDVLAVEFKVNFLTPARGDGLVADARVVRSGRTLSVCTIDVYVEHTGGLAPCALMQQTLIRVRPKAAS